MSTVKLEETKDRRRLHIGSFFVDLNETDYQELIIIFGQKAKKCFIPDVSNNEVAVCSFCQSKRTFPTKNEEGQTFTHCIDCGNEKLQTDC